MGLSVIGAGFGRTGTMSMKQALDLLGFGPCHHMSEVMAREGDADKWAAAFRGEGFDADALLDGFESMVDFPGCWFWEELAADNPDALVLLTVRPTEGWWRSLSTTIGPHIHPAVPHGDESFGALMSAIDDVVFAGRADDRDTAVSAYERHNAHVVATAPADRLLVYEVGSGWEPLCEALGVPVPDEPFPRTNTSEEWQQLT